MKLEFNPKQVFMAMQRARQDVMPGEWDTCECLTMELNKLLIQMQEASKEIRCNAQGHWGSPVCDCGALRIAQDGTVTLPGDPIKRCLQIIRTASRNPDLSCSKHLTSFEIIAEQAKKAMELLEQKK